MNAHTLRATALSATLLSTLAASTLAAQAATIGLMAPLSGPQAIVGQDQVDGFMLALEQLGGKLGGQPTSILKEDDQLKTRIARARSVVRRGWELRLAQVCIPNGSGNGAV